MKHIIHHAIKFSIGLGLAVSPIFIRVFTKPVGEMLSSGSLQSENTVWILFALALFILTPIGLLTMLKSATVLFKAKKKKKQSTK